MIQYELFLKEISDFLRSCTIKNKYFAQITANKVMTKYGLSSLPDHFNPYYLRMCGLSTLDLVIPTYLYDEDGRRIINEDYKYRRITDTDPDLTHLIMVRLDKVEEDELGNPVYIPTSEKLNVGIQTIEDNLGPLYLKCSGYTNSDGSLYTGKTEFWILDAKDTIVLDRDRTPSKALTLRSLMTRYNPDDDGAVVNIITGDLSWSDLARNCAVFSNGYTVNDISKVTVSVDDDGNITNYINDVQVELSEGDVLNVTAEQSTYIRSDQNTWVKRSIDDMFDMAVKFYAAISKKRTPTGKSISDTTTFVRSTNLPYVEALVVIGAKHLDWDGMYEAGYHILETIDAELHNGVQHGALIDVEFNKINNYLGYAESTYPQAGSRVNYLRSARAWVHTDSNGVETTIYTATENPVENEVVYSDPNLTETVKEGEEDVRVMGIDGNDTKFLFTTDSNNTDYKRDATIAKDRDVVLKHCTYEFNGIDWVEVPLRKLFDEEWKYQFNEKFSKYPNFTYTTMSNPFDTESFNENLVLDDENNLVLDRYEYLGWDKPVYVPTYDKENELTKDFTLYTRFSNHMREEHIKTALKYHIGSKVYTLACEKYPEYIDFIKGVCYPAHRHNRDLASKSARLRYTYITGDNGVPVRIATKEEYERYISNIELAISEIASDPNFTLERYDSTLLKENEADSIIDCINRVLKCVRERWDVGEFGYEELYYAAMWATLWAHLPYLILVQRILNLRTESVHVDHIWEYLEGKGLKDYRTVMDNDQQLFLYKNIDYLRGNEGKQSTLKILVEKLLERFSATVRTKSVLLDTTYMKENLADRTGNNLTLTNGSFNVNGLGESVSGEVKILSEDLEEQTSVISDVDGRIEDYDDIYVREYKSGLVPKLGDTLTEQRQRITESHDEVEKTKHTYAPTKLAEITQGNTTSDTARLAMAFIFQTLIRKLSSGTEISNSCVVNAIFHGLSSPKTFTIGECLALIFYALRRQSWYTYKNKYGEQIFHKNDLWKSLVNADGDPISVSERNTLIGRLKSYEDCPKFSDPAVESDCNHEFYTINEIFNDSIPSKADIWLPYLGAYTKFDTDELVDISVPVSVSGLDALISNPSICISGRTLIRHGSYREFMQILSPYEYPSLELSSWNDMCDAEIAGNVPAKYDASIGGLRRETQTFQKVAGTNAAGGTADGSLVGGLVTGSSRAKQDKWYIAPIPDPDLFISSHDQLMDSLCDQANAMLNHYQLTRSKCDAYFHFAMSTLYKCITITDKIKLDLVPGYTTFTEWFESDVELKSVFRAIEEGADQASIYGSIADNLISALFPADKIVIMGSVDQTKYAAMKELFQWLGSYNIAYLNTSSVQYETLFIHPITINCTWSDAVNYRPWLYDYDKSWCSIGGYIDGQSGRVIEHWSTSHFEPGLHIHYWPAIASGWSLSSSFSKSSGIMYEVDPDHKGTSCVSLNGKTAEETYALIYGSTEDALEIPVYKESDIKRTDNALIKSGITRTNFYIKHKSTWTSNSKPSDPSTPWDPWHSNADFRSDVIAYVGSATYEEISPSDKNNYHQTDVTLEPIYIHLNQQ